jgi:hypothetical protein
VKVDPSISKHKLHLTEETTDEHDNPLVLYACMEWMADLATKLRGQVRSYTKNCREVRLVGVMAHNGRTVDAERVLYRISGDFTEDGIQYEVCRCGANPPMC